MKKLVDAGILSRSNSKKMQLEGGGKILSFAETLLKEKLTEF
ncbi:MAG: hypothetical protein SPL52_10975 [Fibrobacter sp.]|nr:hypothetical protein [Fibrobacter sp.]